MKKRQHDFEVVLYPKLRRGLAVTLRSAQRRPMIHGLTEVDVTRARKFLREHQANTGESLSFTAFIITCVARAVDENKAVQACRKGNKHLVLFDEVDVATTIERDIAGQKQPLIYIIRAANKKTFREIHREIRAAQVQAVEQAWEGFRDFRFLPLVVFRCIWPIFWWMLGRYPQVQKKYGGTVGLTAIGMFGKGAGWGIPVANRTQITLGGIIVAQSGVPIQITFKNTLPRKHILPVDTSANFKNAQQHQNATTTHVHGGFTPWISDGGPFTWFTPDGQYGPSVHSAKGNIYKLLNPHLKDGQAEYYFPNHQSARLVWYHDHAQDLTRLNAYAGIASAYIIRDSFEANLRNRDLPDFVENGGREIPIVIQDKIFVGANIGTKDPTWPGPTGAYTGRFFGRRVTR